MIFRQLFEPLSSTYTYLLACQDTGRAVLVDPVVVTMERDLAEIGRLGLTLAFTVETHIHADHITAALELKNKVGSRIVAPAFDQLACVDVGIAEGTPFTVGSIELQPLPTPGHTAGHFAYLLGDRLLTGDALLIEETAYGVVRFFELRDGIGTRLHIAIDHQIDSRAHLGGGQTQRHARDTVGDGIGTPCELRPIDAHDGVLPLLQFP